MQTKKNTNETANVLICVLATILILSLVGANVMQSSATRLNVSTNQVRSWKEALSAAETGGDIAFAEVKKFISDPTNQWPSTQWTNTGVVTGFPNGTKHVLSPSVTFGNSNLVAQTTVEAFYFDNTNGFTLVDSSHLTGGNVWYRIRSKGTAPLPNLRRTGVDDGIINDGIKHFDTIGSTTMQDVTARGKGNSLLRKIDFNYDHFVASYGPNGDGLNKALVAPVSAPSMSRRIEQIVTPKTPFFDAAIKTQGSFYGLGAASFIDSYNSFNGLYDPTIKTNPSSPYYSDSRHGNVEVGSATASVKGSIYGDVATDGGNVTQGNPGIVFGTIDNNVPMTLSPYRMPTNMPAALPSPASVSSIDQTITPPGPGTNNIHTNPNYYLVSSITKALTLQPTAPGVNTYVTIHVTGDISGNNAAITVLPNVRATIIFDGNVSMKSVNIQNSSPNTFGSATSYGPFSGNLQFYGVSATTGGRSQTINLDSGGGQPQIFATFYAPSADVLFQGAPDFYGTVTGKTFYANGNITWHYDRALNDLGDIQDYQIASYVEDTR